MAVALCWAELAVAQPRRFDVPSLPANRAIPLFGQQAGIQIIAPGSLLRTVRTNEIKGEFDIRAALTKMLEGTPVRIVSVSADTITLGAAPAV